MIKLKGNFNIKPYYPTKVIPVYERDIANITNACRPVKSNYR